MKYEYPIKSKSRLTPLTTFTEGHWYECTGSGSIRFQVGTVYMCVSNGSMKYLVDENYLLTRTTALDSKFVQVQP